MVSVHFQGKPFHIPVIQVYAPTTNAKEAEVEQFYKDLQNLLELTPEKDVLFLIGDWNAKVTGKFGLGVQNEAKRTKANRVLGRERTGHSKHPLPTTQENTLHSTHGHHQIVNIELRLIIFFSVKDGEAL